MKEGVEALKSYIQDTADFLRKLGEIEALRENEFMFVMDVVALYPSVPRDKAREAMVRSLEAREL